MSDSMPVVGVTMGDPAGIGPEIIVNAYDSVYKSVNMVVLGDADVISQAIEIADVDLGVNPITAIKEAEYEEGVLDVLHFDNVESVEFGEISGAHGRASIEYVERAIELAMEGSIDAMANAPINKEAMSLAGSNYAGHTNLLADRTETENHAMLIVTDDFIVSHVTAHIPLTEVSENITPERVADTIRVTHEGVKTLGIENPSIGVNGLNPHAGESGVLGTEDEEMILPGIESVQDEEIDVHGPLPADSVYNQALNGQYDAIIAMYHDQGHIPAFINGYVEGGGVAGAGMTAGLPIVRTTTVHGTAHDIAGENIAVPDSMADAIETAAKAGRNSSR